MDGINTTLNQGGNGGGGGSTPAAIEGEWLRAYLVRNDLTEIDNQDARFKDIFTL